MVRVGDRVRCIRTGSGVRVGNHYTVTAIEDGRTDSRPHDLITVTGVRQRVLADRLEVIPPAAVGEATPVPQAPPAAPPVAHNTPHPFQVGDRVHVSANTTLLGVIYEIDAPWYRVEFVGGGRNGYRAGGLTLITEGEETMPQYNVGDKVRMSNTNNFGDDCRGQVGEIVRISSGRYTISHITNTRAGRIQTVIIRHEDEYLTLVKKAKEMDVITSGDVVYLVDPEAAEPRRIKEARIEEGVPYIVEQVTDGSDSSRYVRLQRNGDNRESSWVRVECMSKEQPTGLFKFWMVIRDDAKQTGTRYPKYDDAVEASKTLATASPEHEFAILEALVKVQADGESFKADTLKG